jgi:hypothetical protein
MNWLAFLAKLIPHVDKLDDLAKAVEAVVNAQGSAEIWRATKVLGDLLQPIVETVVGFEVTSEEAAIEAMKLGDGRLIGRIGKFIKSPLGQTLLQLLLGQILKTASES